MRTIIYKYTATVCIEELQAIRVENEKDEEEKAKYGSLPFEHLKDTLHITAIVKAYQPITKDVEEALRISLNEANLLLVQEFNHNLRKIRDIKRDTTRNLNQPDVGN
jgi:predicted phage-related endonuclease